VTTLITTSSVKSVRTPDSHTSLRKAAVWIAALLAGGALGVATVTLASEPPRADRGHSAHRQIRPSPRQRAEPATSLPPGIASRFGVFRRPRGQADVLPDTEADDAAIAFIGGNYVLSRRVPAGGGSAWLVAGTDGLCLMARIDGASSHTCGSVSTIEAGRFLLVSTGGPSGTTIAGIVPDGVDEAVVTDTAGARHAVAVQDNTFVLTDDSTPAGVVWTGPDGERSMKIPGVDEPAAP
jgi:hypothetical protein